MRPVKHWTGWNKIALFRSSYLDVFFWFMFGIFDSNDLKISSKELIFQKSLIKRPCMYISGSFTAVIETVTPRNWNCCGQSLAGLPNFQEVIHRVLYPKKV